jgi:hypothetical protein
MARAAPIPDTLLNSEDLEWPCRFKSAQTFFSNALIGGILKAILAIVL